jgi:hypothetical protein
MNRPRSHETTSVKGNSFIRRPKTQPASPSFPSVQFGFAQPQIFQPPNAPQYVAGYNINNQLVQYPQQQFQPLPVYNPLFFQSYQPQISPFPSINQGFHRQDSNSLLSRPPLQTAEGYTISSTYNPSPSARPPKRTHPSQSASDPPPIYTPTGQRDWLKEVAHLDAKEREKKRRRLENGTNEIPSVVPIEGTGIVLQTEEDIQKWVEERKKKWPTDKRIKEKVCNISTERRTDFGFTCRKLRWRL